MREVFTGHLPTNGQLFLRTGLIRRFENDGTLPATRAFLGEAINTQLASLTQSLPRREKRNFQAYLRRLRKGSLGILADLLVGSRGVVQIPVGQEVKIVAPLGDTFTLSDEQIKAYVGKMEDSEQWLSQVRSNQADLASKFINLNISLLHG